MTRYRYAISIIRECQQAWERLINNEVPSGEISLVRTDESLESSGEDELGMIDEKHEDLVERDKSHSQEDSLDKWFFIRR